MLEGTDEFANLELAVRQHARFVFKVAYGVLRNSHDAEDVVQEVFLRVHRTGSDGRTGHASVARDDRVPLGDRPQAQAGTAGHRGVRTARHGARRGTQSRSTASKSTAMHRLIAALPEDLRYPLVLSALEELNSRQIGEILGIPESSVRGRILRARQMLKEKAGSNGTKTMNHDEHFDNILDEALSEYRDAEPLAGLEHRVLNGSRRNPPRAVRAGCAGLSRLRGLAILLAAAGLILQSRRPPHNESSYLRSLIPQPSTVASQSEAQAHPS